MSTLQSWVDDVRYHLEGDAPVEANQVHSTYTAGSGTLVVRHAMGNIAAGSLISIGTNTLYVVSVSGTAALSTATVIGGFGSSTDANASAASLIRVKPRFTDDRIVKAINAHLNSLSSPKNGLYAVDTIDLDYSAAYSGYELDATVVDVLEVRGESTDGSRAWAAIRASEWDLLRNADATDFPSGVGLRLYSGDSGFGVQVVVATAFTQITNLAADTTTTGIPATADDIPPLGAAIRLMSGREVSRNDTRSQGDTRRSTEVPAGAVARSYAGLAVLWNQRVTEESARLKRHHPIGT
jgi:hypothetical protein